MSVDPWIEKAWHHYRQTECFPDTTILKAALWLEKKHDQKPEWNTAAVIALHYFILAIREEAEGKGALLERHLSKAMHWKMQAIRHWVHTKTAETRAMRPRSCGGHHNGGRREVFGKHEPRH